MISLNDYFSKRLHHPQVTQRIWDSAEELLTKVNGILDVARFECGYAWPKDPDTGTCVSGSKGGSGDGGWRPAESVTGSPTSKHRSAHAVDVYDPDDMIDTWLTDRMLEEHGLYREHPNNTPGWCHLQDVAPGSGNRTFIP